MSNKTIILPIEKWDRILELLEFVNHPDKESLLTDINTQLHYSPADEPINFIPIKSDASIKRFNKMMEEHNKNIEDVMNF